MNQFQDKYKFDCLHFKGYKPCKARRVCVGCNEYQLAQPRILIIKLGALGDVLRTTPILHAFRRKYPHGHITWVTKGNARNMLGTTPLINRLLSVDDGDNGAVLRLQVETFDEVHCYDKEDAAIALATMVRAEKKYGFYMNPLGHMAPINEASVYSFDLGLSDELKFIHNKKTYQELTYESSELPIPSRMDPYEMPLTDADRNKAEEALLVHGLGGRPIVGLNTGSGKVFRTKQWLEDYFESLARSIKERMGADIILLGGKDEDERNKRLAHRLPTIARYLGCDFSVREFAAVLERCSVAVTGDTLAMHLALTVGTPTVALFGATCDQEVDMYGIGEKLVSRPACAPCYKNECDKPDQENMRCMKDIAPNRVYDAVARLAQSTRLES